MPRCTHKSHVHAQDVDLLYGFDITRRQWQLCDEGLVITRKERRNARPRYVTARDREWNAYTEIHIAVTAPVEVPKKARKETSSKGQRFLRRAAERKGRV